MMQLATKTSIIPAAPLSISYRSPVTNDELENSTHEGVIITDPNFIVKGFNGVAASVYGFSSISAYGQLLFRLIPVELIGTSLHVAKENLFRNGYWKGDIIYNHCGKKLIFSCCCNLIKDNTGINTSIVISLHMIGSMQEITERKKPGARLLLEQVEEQRRISQAIIKAQENERDRIGAELHDNVNQLLMSARMHICVAKNKEDGQKELLEKANEYLLLAVEEIRGLSKSLTSTIITTIGLQKSIADIAATMLLLKNMQLKTDISNEVIEKLSAEKQLMIYRIIQEQSNNILKYAETNEADISLKEVDHQVELIISDNGRGFDKTNQQTTGIGFINIFNRVDAHKGKVEIITSPGNGCVLKINFPILNN